jgi:hypothetical protein
MKEQVDIVNNVPFFQNQVWARAFMTSRKAGLDLPAIVRLRGTQARRAGKSSPTGPHRRCDMFIRTKDDSGSITLKAMARGFGQQPVKG